MKTETKKKKLSKEVEAVKPAPESGSITELANADLKKFIGCGG